MGRSDDQSSRIGKDALERYLRRQGHPAAKVIAMGHLGDATGDDLKSYGYGKPLRVRFEANGQEHDIVMRTMSPDPFGHERHADRVGSLLLDFDTFGHIPQHITALDVGTFSEAGELVSMARGEPFLITNYVEGHLYAEDLNALRGATEAAPLDLQRVRSLASYLADLHSVPAEGQAYTRALRDTVGSGEGIFGQTDAFAQHPSITTERLMRYELEATRWRWRLKSMTHRARRTHGDFHPFNILFREGADFSVLDCSRGAAGDPADDVACLAVNFLFYGLRENARFDGPYRALWDAFWQEYLARSGDEEILSVVAPYFAWRLLVLANPVWYANLEERAREQLFRFGERLLANTPFTPRGIDSLVAP